MSDSHIPWKWTRRFAVGLSASVAGFSAFNFIAPFLPERLAGIPIPDLLAGMLLAAIVGNAQGLANCMAANARRVGAGGHVTAGKWCWAFCVGFAATSWFGLHNGWEMVQANAVGYVFPDPMLMDALFAFIAMSEPTMNWIVDLLKSLQRAEEREDEKRVRDEAAEREMRQRDAEVRRKALRAVAAPAAAVASLGSARTGHGGMVKIHAVNVQLQGVRYSSTEDALLGGVAAMPLDPCHR